MRPNISPFEQIQHLCAEETTRQEILKEGQIFAQESNSFAVITTQFHQKIKKISLRSVVLFWSQCMVQDRMFGERNLNIMVALLQSGIFPLKRGNAFFTLADFALQRHDAAIDAIRSHLAWTTEEQEKFVMLYIEFASWLSKESYALVSWPVDLDRLTTTKRKLPFEKYIQLLAHLPSRERIFVKLYYLGGARILDDILNIKIEDVDFLNKMIHFSDYSVPYSGHVLHDLKQYVESRTNGFVFVNKYGERINHTVPYRSLKLAAAKLGFPSNFTFKDLVQEA